MRKIGMTFRWALLLAVAMTLMVAAGHQAYSAKPDMDNVLTVLLVPDGLTFDQVESPGGSGHGPFYIGGTIFDLDGVELGEFQCWGWFFTESRRTVTQEWNLGDRGTILVAGEELVNPLGITGGTGDFSNVRGQMEFVEFSAAGVLSQFTLIGADASP